MKRMRSGLPGRLGINGRWLAATLALVAAGTATAAVSPPQPVYAVDEPVAHAAANPALTLAGGVSDNGRWIVLSTTADHLAVTDQNRAADVILFDRTAGTVSLVSVNHRGSNGGNGASLGPALSADGRRIAFQSRANDLVAGDANARWDVFVRDLETGTTGLASASVHGAPGNGPSGSPQLSADGRYLLFESLAQDLVASPGIGRQWYLRDLTAERTVAVARGIAGAGAMTEARLSANGAWLAVAETRVDDGVTVVWVDLLTGQVQRIPVSAAATRSATPRARVALRPAAASADGRYLAWLSTAADPAAGYVQVVVRDTVSGDSWLASARPDGQPADRNCSAVSMDASGRWVAFVTSAVLEMADSDTTADVFLFDRETERTQTLTLSLRDGGRAREPVLLSPDGRFVHFGWGVTTETAASVCEVATGRMERLRTANAITAPSFSTDSRLFAASFNAATPRSEVYDLSAWFAENPVRTVFYGLHNRGYCALSGDGQRLGIVNSTLSGGARAVQTVDLPTGQVRIHFAVTNTATTTIAVDRTGERLVWSVLDTTPRQVWTARIGETQPTLVSVAPDGSTPGNGGSRYPVMTPDGRRVAFVSDATNLAEGDANGARDVFVRDLETGRTLLASRGATGDSGSGWSVAPVLSGDGSVLFFATHASNLLPGDFNDAADAVRVELSDDLLLTLERALGAATARLRWNGAPGARFRVECAADLLKGPWQTLADGVEAATGFAIDLAAAERRFYRVAPAP